MNAPTKEELMSGENFRIERLRHRLSQWQIARKTGIHPGRISRYENGIYCPLPSEHKALHGVIEEAIQRGSPYTKKEQE